FAEFPPFHALFARLLIFLKGRFPQNIFQKSSPMAPMEAEILFGQGFGCNLLQPIATNGSHLSSKLQLGCT
ncbi:hypothetical protein, partial [Flavobacterium ginsengisoli]|uniref:hypothetical protein n=1 Tax=Flavobacterium ginsengisoli TaxID=871694 RepID=UPI0031E72D67